jgi:excisionase family DNA binding protein
MTGVPSQFVCGAEYTRPGGRQPGDRIVRCDLPAAHLHWPRDHCETATGSTWPLAANLAATGSTLAAPVLAAMATATPEAVPPPVPADVTGDRLLTPAEVAALWRVDPKTVSRWAAAGRVSSIRTPGGHRRFRESEVRALLEVEGDR